MANGFESPVNDAQIEKLRPHVVWHLREPLLALAQRSARRKAITKGLSVQRYFEGTQVKRARAVHQLDRQQRAFDLTIQGVSVRAIAKELDMSTRTVQSDVKAESALRAAEHKAERSKLLAQQLARINNLCQESMKLKGTVGVGALASAAKALPMRAALHGLNAVVKTETNIPVLEQLWAALLPSE